MRLNKLKLQDLNDADLSQLTITYENQGQVCNNKITISDNGCCTIWSWYEEKKIKLSQRKVISILNKIVSCGFFELKESRPNFTIKNKKGRLSLSEFYLLDGLSQSLTVQVGRKQRSFGGDSESCIAMCIVFRELDKLIMQVKKV